MRVLLVHDDEGVATIRGDDLELGSDELTTVHDGEAGLRETLAGHRAMVVLRG